VKQLFFIVILLIGGIVNAQTYFNQIYDFNEQREFSREIFVKENKNIINTSTYIDNNIANNVGQLIREFDESGQLLWEENIVLDSTSLYGNWRHCYNLQNDSILLIFAPSEKSGYIDTYPYFLKYDLNNKVLLSIEFYDLFDIGSSIYSAILHSDGFLYGAGKVSYSETINDEDLLIMKIDLDGNLIWSKTFDKGEVELVFEIESFGQNIILSGIQSGPFIGDTETFVLEIDTSGIELNYLEPIPFGSNGIIETEVYNNEIYFATETQVIPGDGNSDDRIQYLAKFDSNLNVVWEKTIEKTDTYGINYRRMEILNDEIIIAANILDSLHLTNNTIWSYACSYDLDGNFNWEHVYYYDSTYTHHIDDIEVAENGDLIFMGTVFKHFTDPDFNQFLWLFRTDADGCGTVQDICYTTMEDYFYSDSMLVSTYDFVLEDDLISIQGNPFQAQLSFTINATITNNIHYEIFDINSRFISRLS